MPFYKYKYNFLNESAHKIINIISLDQSISQYIHLAACTTYAADDDPQTR